MSEPVKPLSKPYISTKVVVKNAWGQDATVMVHANYMLSPKAQLAASILERIALVAAEPDGEDSAGRQKIRMQSPREAAHRATDLADAIFTIFEHNEGWLIATPSIEQMETAQNEAQAAREALDSQREEDRIAAAEQRRLKRLEEVK